MPPPTGGGFSFPENYTIYFTHHTGVIMGKKRRLKRASAKFAAKHSAHPRARLLASLKADIVETEDVGAEMELATTPPTPQPQATAEVEKTEVEVKAEPAKKALRPKRAPAKKKATTTRKRRTKKTTSTEKRA